MTELNHATFDLLGVLTGRDYPELNVDVYFNEKLYFDIEQLEEKRDEAFRLDSDDKAEIDKKLSELVESTSSEKFVANLKSISEQTRKDIATIVAEKFPTKRNFMGAEEPNPEGDELFTKKLWAAYIQTIGDPDGAISLVNEEMAENLYNLAPSGFHKRVNEGIKKLQTGAEAGYETATKELNFLSDASPEG